jgi:hypothetical protein
MPEDIKLPEKPNDIAGNIGVGEREVEAEDHGICMA